MRRKTVAARLFLATSSCALATGVLATAALASETVTYSYDALGRLVGTSSSGTVNNGLATSIGYDPAGNRQSYGVTGASSGSGSGSGGGGIATVADGSFETPPLGGSGYVNRPTVPGLSFTGWSGITSNSSDWAYGPAPDGAQAAFIDTSGGNDAAIEMSMTGLTPGTSYSVSFMLANRPYYAPMRVRVSVNGAPLGDYTPTSVSFATFTTPAFTATGTTATLRFTGMTIGDVALDKVTVAP